MTDNLNSRRLVQAGALFLIGDGLMGLIKPRWHSLLWHIGPQVVKAATEELAAHRTAARAVYAAELVIGLALAMSATPEKRIDAP